MLIRKDEAPPPQAAVKLNLAKAAQDKCPPTTRGGGGQVQMNELHDAELIGLLRTWAAVSRS
jgi:hypothetical protein